MTKALGNDDHYRFVQLFLDEGVIDFEKFVENRLKEVGVASGTLADYHILETTFCVLAHS